MYTFYDKDTGVIQGNCSSIGGAGPTYDYIAGSYSDGYIINNQYVEKVIPYPDYPATTLSDLRQYVSRGDTILNKAISNLGVNDVDAYRRTNYITFRLWSYPPQANFSDAWVKEDNIALEQYRTESLQVKERFPKPIDF